MNGPSSYSKFSSTGNVRPLAGKTGQTPPVKKGSRKVWLINPRFQMGFMVWMAGMSLGVVGIFYSAIYYFFWKFKQLALSAGLSGDHVIFEFLGEQQSQMDWIFVLTSAGTLVLVGIGAYLFSHRIAGPIHRLHKHVDGVLNGTIRDEVKFRRHDYFQELAASCNQLFAVVKKMKRTSPSQMKPRKISGF